MKNTNDESKEGIDASPKINEQLLVELEESYSASTGGVAIEKSQEI